MLIVCHQHQVVHLLRQCPAVVAAGPHAGAAGNGNVHGDSQPLRLKCPADFPHEVRQPVLILRMNIFKVDVDAVQLVFFRQ